VIVTEGLVKRYGKVLAVDGVDLDVRPGDRYGLLGPNGSGKTTLLNILSGFLRPSAGRVVFEGADTTDLPPQAIGRRGLRRTFQLPRMPGKMSCAELLVAAIDQPTGATVLGVLARPRKVRREERDSARRAFAMLERLELNRVAHEPAAAVSGGQQKLLALGAALLGGARLLLLDEPTAGVNPALRRRLVDTLHEARREGVTLVVVEHDMEFVGRLCDRCVVLDRGTLVADCAPQDLTGNERVIEAYLGKRARTALQPMVA
jgi:branched-chain amino acid transport system ATP-binding protein